MEGPKPLDTTTIENDIKFIYDQGGTDEDVDNYLKENGVDYESHQASTDKVAEDQLAELPPEAKKPEMLDVMAGGITPNQLEISGHPYAAAAQRTGKQMATPALHYLNQRALNVPRQLAEAGGMEYVGDSENPVVEGVSKLAGFAGGVRTFNKLRSAINPSDPALVKAGKGALEGAAYSGAMSGVQDVVEGAGKLVSGDISGATQDLTEFGQKLGIGAAAGFVAAPTIAKGSEVLKKVAQNSIEFYRKNAAGYSQQFADTVRRLGKARVFDPLKVTGEYVSKTLVPRVSKGLSDLLMSRNKNNIVEILDYLKLKPEEIDDVLSLEPRYKQKLAEGATKSGYKIYKEVELELQDLGSKIGGVLIKAQKQNKMIKINETMNLFKKILVDGGYLLSNGQPSQLAAASKDPVTLHLLQLYSTIDNMTSSPNLRFRQPIGIAEYKMLKNALENLIRADMSKNIPIYQISRRLTKDVSKQVQGIKGLYNKYSQLMTYKDVWRKLYDKSSPTAIENVLNSLRAANPNQGMARVLFTEKFSNIFGKETTDELMAWIAAQEHQETVGLARGVMRAGYNAGVSVKEGIQKSSSRLADVTREFSPKTKSKLKETAGYARIGKGSSNDDNLLNEIESLTREDYLEYTNRDTRSKIGDLEGMVEGTLLEKKLTEKVHSLGGKSTGLSKYKRTPTEQALKDRGDLHYLNMQLSEAQQRSDDEMVRVIKKKIEAISKKTQGQSSEPVTLAEKLKAGRLDLDNDEYVYHATGKKNIEGIRGGGLQPHLGQYGKGVYFGPSIHKTLGYGGPDEVIMRVKRSNLPKDYQEWPNEQGWTPSKIPLKDIEISMDMGKTWKALSVLLTTGVLTTDKSQAQEVTTKSMSDKDGMRAILGEAESGDKTEKQMVAEITRRRGSLQGIYGANYIFEKGGKWYRKHSKNGSLIEINNRIVEEAKDAWNKSKTSNLSDGATHWQSDEDLKKSHWDEDDRFEIKGRRGHHTFLLEKRLKKGGKK